MRKNRFFDRDYDPIRSVLHVLARRLTWSSPTQTCHRDCFSPSLTHFDDDEVDLASHVRVPTSDFSRDHMYRPTFSLIHTAAVSLQWFSSQGRMIPSAA